MIFELRRDAIIPMGRHFLSVRNLGFLTYIIVHYVSALGGQINRETERVYENRLPSTSTGQR
jgi:hypothetical protein